MADADHTNAEGSTPKAPKDKACKFCGQSFTSSSLGRHLDLYIRDKNPKPPDGIHNVDEIRKLREGITRRQPRASLARRDTSTPAATPSAVSRKSPRSEADSSNLQSPVAHREGQSALEATAGLLAFTPRWEATGVINDILPSKGGEASRDKETGAAADPVRRPLPPRAVSRQQLAKAQFDMKQRVQDAMDTSRAAELALRELISSWRAAKQYIDMNSMPFDFDPLSMDFPALTLQCLQPPPTLFSSTQHSTPTSWSITPPGAQQLEALEAYFKEEFRKFAIHCAAATTAVNEDLTYPPSATAFKPDVKDAVRKAEKTAESLECQVSEHLQSAFSVWDSLPPQRQSELWVLELARSVGRKQKEVDKLKETQHSLKQENANLKTQIDHLNRLQQPREFKILPPSTIPVTESLLNYMQEVGLAGARKAVGLNIDDRHSDLNTIVFAAIDRWKNVIVAARSVSGMNAQRQLDQTPGPNSAAATASPAARGSGSSSSSSSGTSNATTQAAASIVSNKQTTQPQQVPKQQPQVPTLQHAPQPRHQSTASSTGPTTTTATTTATTTPSAPSVEDMSDQDADAEMEDDDDFAQMNAAIAANPPPPPIPQQQTAQLEVPRTRGSAQGLAAGSPAKGSFAKNGTRGGGAGSGGSQINMSRSMPNMNSTSLQGLHHAAPHADMSMAMQGLGGEPMFMD